MSARSHYAHLMLVLHPSGAMPLSPLSVGRSICGNGVTDCTSKLVKLVGSPGTYLHIRMVNAQNEAHDEMFQHASNNYPPLQSPSS